MKPRHFADSFSRLPLLALIACGSSGTPAPIPAAKPQIVFEGPGVPGSTSIQELSTGNLNGSNTVQITHDGLNEFLAHFSPDGTLILVFLFCPSDPEQVGVTLTDTTGTTWTFITPGFAPDWNPTTRP